MSRGRSASRAGAGSLVELASAATAGVDRPRVAVIARRPSPGVVSRLDLPARTDVAVCALPMPPSRLHLELAARGPYDLVLDVAGGNQVARRFVAVVWHARPGGIVAVQLPRPGSPAGGRAREFADALLRWHDDPESLSDRRRVHWLKPKDRRTLVGGLESVDVQDGHLVALVALDATPKVSEEIADELLGRRPDRGRVLDTLPAVSWTSGAQVRFSRRPPLNPLPSSYDAPQVSLREYDDAVCLPGRGAISELGVLPESFRFRYRPQLRSHAVRNVSPGFALRPDPPSVELTGSYYHFSNPLPRHFGHAVTEQVSHAWGWSTAKERDPTLRALLVTSPSKPVAPWELEVVEACGVERSEIVTHEGPVRVEHLVDASALYDIGSFVHPAMRDTFDKIGARLAARADGGNWGQRIFHTRRNPKRRCRNQDEVEALFAGAGFEILLPETDPLPIQVARVRAARIVAGFAGSGMFHIALAGGPRHVVTIGHEGYPAHNEYMMCALLGHRLDMVVCRPDVPRGPGFDREAFHSDYVVDKRTDGGFLREVLASIDE